MRRTRVLIASFVLINALFASFFSVPEDTAQADQPPLPPPVATPKPFQTRTAAPVPPTVTFVAQATSTPTGTVAPSATPIPSVPTVTSQPGTATTQPPTGTANGQAPTATQPAAATSTPGTSRPPLVVGAGGYPTISAAVGASTAGDIIKIRAGTYAEEITVNKTLTLMPYGDGPVWIDAECTRSSAISITANDVQVQGLGLKRSIIIAAFIQQGASRATIDSNTIQDFNCQNADDQYHAGVGAWYAGPGQRVTNNTITRRVQLSGNQAGTGDGIWFKSNSSNPSGGGHYIGGNRIVGGFDGIGGEVENDPRGGFDRNTIIERNTIRTCWDDGIQIDGGGQNVIVQDNVITDCGDGISFAPVLTGPATVQRNTISGHTPGFYGQIICFKIGNTTTATVNLTGNQCVADIPSAYPVGTDMGKGIEQTNGGLGGIVSRNNSFNVSGYIFEFAETPLAGSSFDSDCLQTTDPDRFAKYGGTTYSSLAAFQTGTGQEPSGQVAC